MHLLKRYNKEIIKDIAKDFEFMTQHPLQANASEQQFPAVGSKTMQSFNSVANLKYGKSPNKKSIN